MPPKTRSQTLNVPRIQRNKKGIYYKILHADLQHYGIKYKPGHNRDILPFNPSGSCLEGGLYFAEKKDIAAYFHMGPKIASVIIPDSAQVYPDPEGHKFKADEFILEDIIDLKDSPLLRSKKICKQAIDKWVMNIKYMKQTDELCWYALRINSTAIQYINIQTEKMCVYAIKEDACNIEYIKYPTRYMILMAIRYDPLVLECISNPTDEICLEALKGAPSRYEEILDMISDKAQRERIRKNLISINLTQ